MPWIAPRPCRSPRCPKLVRGSSGFCQKHKREFWRRQDSARPTSSQRGYGGEWRERRAAFLALHPACSDCGGIATEVDHVVPLSQGGPDDEINFSAKCKPCHSRKTAKESAFGRSNRGHGG